MAVFSPLNKNQTIRPLKSLKHVFILFFFILLSLPLLAIKPGRAKLSPAERNQRQLIESLDKSDDLSAFTHAIDGATNLGLYFEADSLADVAQPLLKKVSDSLSYFEHLRVKARLYTILNRYTQALVFFRRALVYYQKEGYWEEEGHVTVNLAEFYRSARQYPQAHMELSYLIDHPDFENLSNLVKAIAYHRLAAVVNESKQDLDSAILLSIKSLSYSEPDSLLDEMGTSYLELGDAYRKKKEVRAVSYFEKAFKVFKKQERIHYMCNSIRLISAYYVTVEQYDKALVYVDSSLRLAAPYYLPGFYNLAFNRKALILYKLGRYEEAYLYRDSAAIVYRGELKKRFSDELAMQSRRFQTEMATSRLRSLESERMQILEESRAKDQVRRFSLILLIILVLGLFGLYYFFTRLRRNKSHLEESQKALFGANQELLNTLSEKDGLIEEVHHRVKNNLQLITSLIRVQQFQQQDQMTEESRQMVNEILNRVSAMAVVHEKLYAQQHITQLRAREYFSELMEELKTLGGTFSNPLEIEVLAEDVILGVSQGIALGMILSELVANSLKYAFAGKNKPKIRIEVSKEYLEGRSRVVFSYEDNGKGYDDHSKMGMGNRLIMLFTRQLEGESTLDTKDRFYFNLAYWED
tara:strand:+ start:258 stop:2174 length:1917 start_codon:yes stop_codon:yes gene_type:complete